MPIQSQAQRRYLWAKHPGLARKFEAETPKDAGPLPERKSELGRYPVRKVGKVK